jgi:hypothetical protein
MISGSRYATTSRLSIANCPAYPLCLNIIISITRVDRSQAYHGFMIHDHLMMICERAIAATARVIMNSSDCHVHWSPDGAHKTCVFTSRPASSPFMASSIVPSLFNVEPEHCLPGSCRLHVSRPFTIMCRTAQPTLNSLMSQVVRKDCPILSFH